MRTSRPSACGAILASVFLLVSTVFLGQPAGSDDISPGWRAVGATATGCGVSAGPGTTGSPRVSDPAARPTEGPAHGGNGAWSETAPQPGTIAPHSADTLPGADTTRNVGSAPRADTTPSVVAATLRWLPPQPRESRSLRLVIPAAVGASAGFGRPTVDDVPDAPPPGPKTPEAGQFVLPEGLFTKQAVVPGAASAGTVPPAAPQPAADPGRTASIEVPRPLATPKASESLLPPPGDRLPVLPPPEEECQRPKSRRMQEITADIRPKLKAGDIPPPPDCERISATFESRAWSPVTFTWTAPATCNKPLYFDEVQLENYGHTWGPYVQPILSGVHFFATVPLLPYYMGVTPPDECVYSLGYYRPGNCAPYLLDPFPWSVRGALFEGSLWTGLPFVF